MHRNIVSSVCSLMMATVFLMAAIAFAGGDAETKIRGKLVDMNAQMSTITVDSSNGLVKYKVAPHAEWHICLKDRCAEVRGAEGFKVLGEYAKFEEYGLPMTGYSVKLYKQKDQNVHDIDVELFPDKHKHEK